MCELTGRMTGSRSEGLIRTGGGKLRQFALVVGTWRVLGLIVGEPDGGDALDALQIALYRAIVARDFAGAMRTAVRQEVESDRAVSLAGQLWYATAGEKPLQAEVCGNWKLGKRSCMLPMVWRGFGTKAKIAATCPDARFRNCIRAGK
jgi:hypothetical protein